MNEINLSITITNTKKNGKYYPAHIPQCGQIQIAARWCGRITIIGPSEYPVPMVITAWNNPNDAPGEGLADIMKQHAKKGGILNCVFKIIHLQKRIFVDGSPVLDARGNVARTGQHELLLVKIKSCSKLKTTEPV